MKILHEQQITEDQEDRKAFDVWWLAPLHNLQAYAIELDATREYLWTVWKASRDSLRDKNVVSVQIESDALKRGASLSNAGLDTCATE